MPYVGKKPADIIATAVDTTTGTFSGDIDVDGTTNLDVVDIDGAVDMASSLSVTGNLLVGGTTTNHQAGSSQEQLSYIAGDYFAVSRSSNDVAFFNRQTSDGNIINLRKDGTTVGSIGVQDSDNLFIASSTGTGFFFQGSGVLPSDGSGNRSDNTEDIGGASYRFRNLYLSGNVYLGGTGSANAFSDYEEGTWTPQAFSNTTQMSINNVTGYYTKIGNTVHVNGGLSRNDSASLSGSFSIKNLPFTSANNARNYSMTGGFWFDKASAADVVAFAWVDQNVSQILPKSIGDFNDSVTYMTANQLENGRPVYFSATYKTA